jgi:hypothetical protein
VETIQRFADKYRVRVKLDSCRDEIIPGYKAAKELPNRHEYRNHVYVHSDGKSFGVCLLFESPRKWAEAKKKLHAAGFAVRQSGDTEGYATFDPANDAQARLALRLARVKAIKTTSAEILAALAKGRASQTALALA